MRVQLRCDRTTAAARSNRFGSATESVRRCRGIGLEPILQSALEVPGVRQHTKDAKQPDEEHHDRDGHRRWVHVGPGCE